MPQHSAKSFSRRSLLGSAAGMSMAGLLAACSGGNGGSSGGGAGGEVVFWDTPWGAAAYADRAAEIAKGYKKGAVTYQSIPWQNWFQTFSSAVLSRSGPSVSTGGSFMAFQFYKDGAIAPAGNLLTKLEAAGIASDFLPGTVDALRYEDKLMGIPNSTDVRVIWYRKSLLQNAGIDAFPKNWDEFRSAALALKKQGLYTFGIAGSSSATGYQQTFPWILNNGGGLFNEDGHPECVTDRNVEAVEFLLSLVKDSCINPANISYSQDQVRDDVRSGRTAIHWGAAGDARNIFTDAKDITLADPLVGPHGDKGTIFWVSPIMMYDQGSVSDSEDFIVYWLDAVKKIFDDGTFTQLPARKSFVDSGVLKADENIRKIFDTWMPVGRTIGSRAKGGFPFLNTVESSAPTVTSTQQILQGELSATQILKNLQDGYESLLK